MSHPEENPAAAQELPQLLLDNQLCFPLYAAARRIVSRYTPILKPLGITYTQYIVFLALWEAGSATVGELCRRLYLDNGTITPLLKKMEEAGYIARRRSHRDERVVSVELTGEGWALRSRAKDVPLQIGSCIPLSPEEAGTLYGLLHKLLNILDTE